MIESPIARIPAPFGREGVVLTVVAPGPVGCVVPGVPEFEPVGRIAVIEDCGSAVGPASRPDRPTMQTMTFAVANELTIQPNALRRGGFHDRARRHSSPSAPWRMGSSTKCHESAASAKVTAISKRDRNAPGELPDGVVSTMT